MVAQAQLEFGQESSQTLLADIAKAYVYASKHHGAALDQRQHDMIENLIWRRMQAVGIGVPNLGPEFRSRGRSEDFAPTDDANQTMQNRMGELRRQFEQDAISYGCLAELGTDSYATYAPIHQVGRGHEEPSDVFWGVYISENKLCRLAAMLQYHCVREYGEPSRQLFLDASYQILLRFAFAHFKLEAFALNAELMRREPIYLRYLANVYLPLHRKPECLQDALATATILSSQKVNKIFTIMYPPADDSQDHTRCNWREIIQKHMIECQPAGYKNHQFKERWKKSGQPVESLRRMALNYLCNQIITGEVEPKEEVPYFAFPPDNYFLRGELLVPVHLIRSPDGIGVLTQRQKKSRQ